jgi:hypothetical protein
MNLLKLPISKERQIVRESNKKMETGKILPP